MIGTREEKMLARLATLSPRQAQVLARFVAGQTLHEVAAELGLSEAMVRRHVRTIRARLVVVSVAEVVAVACMVGWGAVDGGDQ